MPTKFANSLQQIDYSNKKSVVRSLWTVDKKGFTLIEILVSLFIIMILGIILLTTSGTITQRFRVNLQSVAARVASKEIERLRDIDYASLPASGNFSDSDLSKLPASYATRTITDYQSSTQIKQVFVTVIWQANSVSKQVSMETLIYKYGI